MGTHHAVQQARCCGEDALVCVDGLALGTREDVVHIRGFFVVVETARALVGGHQQGKSFSILALAIRPHRWRERRRSTWRLTLCLMLSLQSKGGMALEANLEKDWIVSGWRARATEWRKVTGCTRVQ